MVIILAVATDLAAQKAPATGLRYDDAEYNEVPAISDFAGSKFWEMPWSCTLKAYAPRPAVQGNSGACAAFAIAYGAYTMEQAIAADCTDTDKITANAYSALYLHSQIADEGCEEGATLIQAAKYLQEQGDYKFADFEAMGYGCDNVHTDHIIDLPQNHRIKSFAPLFSLFKKETDPHRRLHKIKRALADRKPVIVGMDVPQEIAGMSLENAILRNTEKSSILGGHAMVVVGYDDTKNAFEMLNSWGGEWGNEGFFWMDYTDFALHLRYAIVLFTQPDGRELRDIASIPPNAGSLPSGAGAVSPLPSHPHPLPAPDLVVASPMRGDFRFRYKTTQPGLHFDEAAIHLQDGKHYVTDTESWNVGQFFQLYSRNPQAGEYMYVMSVDNEAETYVHWPRSAHLNPRYEGWNESPVMPGTGYEVIVPSPDSALTIDHPGRDFLCILYARKEITDFASRLEKMRQSVTNTQNFMTALEDSFGDRLIPFDEINYSPSRMSFETLSTNGDIAPILLIVNSQ